MKIQISIIAVLLCGLTTALTSGVAAQSSEATIHPTGALPPWPVGLKAQQVGHVDPKQKLRLALGLEPPHAAEEQQLIHDLQDPKSPRFRHFLTAAEWNERFSPSAENEQAVIAWATSQGLRVTNRFPNRLIVDVEGTVDTIEKTLGVNIDRYTLSDNSFFSNDRAPSIPASLGGILHSVIGLNDYQVMKAGSQFGSEQQNVMYSAGATKSLGSSGYGDGDPTKVPVKSKLSQAAPTTHTINPPYDPADMYSSYAYDASALYNLGHCCNPLGNPNVTPPEASIAIPTYGYNNASDFVGFHNTYPYLAYHYQIFNIDGTPSSFDGEGTLDLEWATAMANSFGAYQNTAMIYLYQGATNASSTWTDMFNQILSDGYARVFTNSHYCDENDCNDKGTMDTQHEIFGSMVGQGWTLIAISGDDGATVGCSSINVAWPGDDPYMLTMGGTTLYMDPSAETGWTGGTATGSCSNHDGGSGGGCSKVFAAPDYQQQSPACGKSSRSVPDLALNADPNTSQTVYVNGQLTSGGNGTSIAAPEMAGFFAQENAYLLYLSAVMGPDCNHLTPCAPIGQPNPIIYAEGFNPSVPGEELHYPFYDITSGCNSNDVTAANNLTADCAGTGYDLVTGWGSVNMLQLAWLFNASVAYDYGAPTVRFQGPTTNKWYNTDQGVYWLATDTSGTALPANGLAGFTGQWDKDPGDINRDDTQGCCDSYYSGPQVTTTDLGNTFVSAAGQGCHTVHVRAWDNTGLESSDNTYGPVCYDSVPPVTTAKLAGTLVNGVYTSPVTVILTATDATSGVHGTVYQINSGVLFLYTAPFTVSGTGSYTISFYSTDNAGNQEATKTIGFGIGDQTKTTLTSLLNPAKYRESIQFAVTVTPSLGGPATGTVTLKDGATSLATSTLIGGKATFTVALTAVGTHFMTAVYAGNSSFANSTSAVLTETIDKAATTTKSGSSHDPSTFGESVTFSALPMGVYSGFATGKVVFKNGNATMATVTINPTTHVATFTTTIDIPGTYSITAIYLGNSDLDGSISPVLKQLVK